MDIQYTVIIILIGIMGCCCHSYNDERLLINYLFSDNRYNKNVRPVLNSSLPTVVNMSYNMYLLSQMNVADESACVYGMVKMSWNDEMLAWNSSHYSGIKNVIPPSGLYWKPNIVFDYRVLACGDLRSSLTERITLESDGTINAFFYGYIGAPCTVDVKLFPFDSHTCAYRFFDMSYDTTTFIIQLQDELPNMKMLYLNQEWNILDIVSSLKQTHILGTALMTYYYECTFRVSRRPGFILLHNVIPAGFVILLSLFVPFIPPDTGERLSYAITTYLATVFMTVSFYDNIPNSSLCITLMSYNLVTYYAISSLSLIWSIGIVCLSKQTTKQMKIPKCISIRLENRTGNNSSDPNMKSFDDRPENTFVNEEGNTGTVDIDKVDYNSDVSRIGWYEASRYLDKLFFTFTLICYLCLLGMNAIVFTNNSLNHCQSVLEA
ncbi:ligand-gated ion channel [Mactra antiquata]